MNAHKKIQNSLNNDISFTDIVIFLILNKKLIVTLIIVGGILGGLYGQFSKQIYNGSILLVPARTSGVFIEAPQKTSAKFQAKLIGGFSKETHLFCPLSALENIKFNNPDNSKFSSENEIFLIKISMKNTDKTIINDCLNHIADEIIVSQNKIAQPIIDFKKNLILGVEKKLKILTEISDKMNENLMVNKTDFNDNLLSSNIFVNSVSEVRLLKELKLKNLDDFSKDELAHKIGSVDIKRENKSGIKNSVFFGIMFGFGLSLLIAFVRKIKSSLSF
jgi:hypothetical protein